MTTTARGLLDFILLRMCDNGSSGADLFSDARLYMKTNAGSLTIDLGGIFDNNALCFEDLLEAAGLQVQDNSLREVELSTAYPSGNFEVMACLLHAPDRRKVIHFRAKK